mmetsp:Transcript_31964/g.47051  ORF Transcript_31964/g.47051 Transcript_31964/m.47051 type:complete len:408 (+) Transcript_31964:84-1307(+)
MSHNSKKLRWALTFISLLYTFDTAISKQLLLLRSDDSRRYCRHESINRCSLEYIKRRRLASGGNLLASVNGLASSASAVLSTHHGGDDGHYRVKHDATTNAQTKRKHISSCKYSHHRRTTIPAAFVSINNHSGASKISAKPLTIQPTTTTTLHLKFKTFEEMIHHHHSTPLLIDFYAPWCGPCKLMKGEISSIRDQLELLGPAVQVVQEQQDEEEEDCSVEDVIALSSVCLEDGYIEEQQLSEGLSSSLLGKEDTTSLLKDLLPPPPPPTTTTKDTQSTTTKQPQSTTLPSGIPVYHVNTNKFPQVGAKNHIAGLPTLVLFYEGEELWRNEGLMKGEEIVSVLSELQEGGWKKKEKEESVVEVRREEEESSSSVDEKKEEKVDAVVIAAAGEVDKKKKKRKGRRLGG